MWTAQDLYPPGEGETLAVWLVLPMMQTPLLPPPTPLKKLPQSYFKAKTSTFLSDAPFPKSEYFFSWSKDSVQE